MRLMVVDSFGSFSLVPYLKAAWPGDVCSMASVSTSEHWQIFNSVAPDVVFVDFANENAVALTEYFGKKKIRPRIVIRCHGYEIQSWFVNSINWSAVDALIVVSPKFRDIAISKAVVSEDKIHVVPNGVDLDRFALNPAGKNRNVAYCGYLNKKKGIALLRFVIESWTDRHFHVAGMYQDEQVRLYLEDQTLPNMTFHGWVKPEQFFQGKRWVISTSITESFGMSIAEGMAMGLTPLVHAWPGAEWIWPRSCIWRTFEELQNIQPLEPDEARAWVAERYSMTRCVEKVVDLCS